MRKKLPTGKELTQKLSNPPAGTYLLLGEEERDKDDFIKLIISRFKRESLSVDRFNCSSDTITEAAGAALSADMFVPQKLVLISNIEEGIKNKANASIFYDMIQQLPGTTVLILSSPANKMSAALSKVSKEMEIGIFWRKFENELASYIREQIGKEGKSINPDAVQMVLQLCGRNRGAVDEALNTLILGTDQQTITPQTVREALTDTSEASVFECVDALFEGKKDALIRVSLAIEAGSHELLFLSLIKKRLQQVETYIEGQVGNDTRSLASLGIPPRQQPLFLQSSKRFTRKKIHSLYRSLYDIEKSLKSGGSRKNILANPLSKLIYSLIA